MRGVQLTMLHAIAEHAKAQLTRGEPCCASSMCILHGSPLRKLLRSSAAEKYT